MEHKLPSEILESRPELTETHLGIIKVALTALGPIGSVLNELFIDIPNRINQTRINETVIVLKDKLRELEGCTIDKEYLRSEDFFDFSRHLFDNCLKIKSAEKRSALAGIYLDSIVNKAEYENSLGHLYMNFVVELAPIQIDIIRFIVHEMPNLEEIGEYIKFYEFYTSKQNSYVPSKYEFKYYCNDLEYKGIVSFGAGLEDYNSTAQLFADSSHKEASVIITELGLGFIEYLRKHNG